MNDDTELKDRLNYIENICESYLKTPGMPKNVIMQHVIKVAKGEINRDEYQ